MIEQFNISSSRDVDVKELSEFLKSEYPNSEITNQSFLEWEYQKNPGGKALVTVGKNSNDELISQYAVIPVDGSVDGKVISGSLSLNTLTEKKYRGKGLFTKTAEETYRKCIDENIHFTVGVPNANSFPGFIHKLKFSHPGDLLFLVKPLKMTNVIKSRLIKSHQKKGDEIHMSFDESILKKNSVSILDVEKDKKVYNDYYLKWSKPRTLFLSRSLEHLKWRYISIPTRNYYILKIMDENSMQAFIVLRALQVYGMRTGVVVDFCCIEDKPGCTLINLISAQLKQQGIDILISAHAGFERECRIIKKTGFFQVPSGLLPQRLPLVCRIHKPFTGQQLLKDMRQWHFTFGDYDVF